MLNIAYKLNACHVLNSRDIICACELEGEKSVLEQHWNLDNFGGVSMAKQACKTLFLIFTIILSIFQILVWYASEGMKSYYFYDKLAATVDHRH